MVMCISEDSYSWRIDSTEIYVHRICLFNDLHIHVLRISVLLATFSMEILEQERGI